MSSVTLVKDEGITLIEVLIVVAIFVVVLSLCVLMLFGANKESRDLKRSSDIGVLRSSMSAVKVQFGSYLEAGCNPGAVAACSDGTLANVMQTINNFRDPVGGPLCVVDCSDTCEYSFNEGMTEDSYEVLFYLEKGIGNYPESGCYSLTENGVAPR